MPFEDLFVPFEDLSVTQKLKNVVQSRFLSRDLNLTELIYNPLQFVIPAKAGTHNANKNYK